MLCVLFELTENYERIVTVWMITVVIEKFATANNPWNPCSEISWPACAGALEGSGIARGNAK
jgi:hypothetical protein